MLLIIPNRSGDTKKSFDVTKAADVAAAKDDKPTPEHMIESADAFLKHMGWDGHQAVLVGHNDTEHRHIHIILNGLPP
jgi:Relaxase/Mobilisation nuclease domain